MKTELGYHRGQQGRGDGLRREGRRRQQARGGRLRQGGARLPARSLQPATTIRRATPAALCTGEAGNGVTGSNADAATCMSAKEAIALEQDLVRRHARRQLWIPAQTPRQPQRQVARQGPALVDFHHAAPRSAARSPARPPTTLSLALQDVRYAADASATSAIPITNGSTADAQQMAGARLCRRRRRHATRPSRCSRRCSPTSSPTRPILRKLRDLGRKVIVWTRSGRRRHPAGRQRQLPRARGGGDGRRCRGAEIHAHVSAARRGAQLAGPRLHGRAARTMRCRCRNCRAMPTRHRRATRTSSSPRWSTGSRRARRRARSC